MILKKFKKEKDITELAVQKKTLTPEQKKKRKNLFFHFSHIPSFPCPLLYQKMA